jgi:hypothetical protein
MKNNVNLQIYCLLDKGQLDDGSQMFVVSPSLDQAIQAFTARISEPQSRYNLDDRPAMVEARLRMEHCEGNGGWDRVGYLNFRVNHGIPKKLPVFATTLQPNMVFS